MRNNTITLDTTQKFAKIACEVALKKSWQIGSYLLLGLFSFLFLMPKMYGQNGGCDTCLCLKASEVTFNLCGGVAPTLKGEITIQGKGIPYNMVNYTWDFEGKTLTSNVVNLKRDTFFEYTNLKSGIYTLYVLYPKCNFNKSVKFTVNDANKLNPKIDATSTQLDCDNPTAVLSNSENYPKGTTLQWSFGGTTIANATGQKLTVSKGGLYSLNVTTLSGCTGSSSIQINDIKEVKPTYTSNGLKTTYPVINQSSATIDFGASDVVWRVIKAVNVNTSLLTMSGSGSNNLTQKYELANNRPPNGFVQYSSKRKDSTTRCFSDSLIFTVVITNETGPFIPDIITPNGDGKNDNWNVIFNNESDKAFHEVHIFNRMGVQVYSKENMSEAWDPYNCPDGVYFYTIINKKDSSKVYKGALTILGRNN